MTRALSTSVAVLRAADHLIVTREAETRWWAAWNAQIDARIAARAAAEARIDDALADMRAGWADEVAFIERWNAMSYAEALAFQRERGL